MVVVDAVLAALAFLGRQGARLVAAMVFAAAAMPFLGNILKPYVTEAIFALLLLAFLRVEPAALRARLAKPGLVAAAALWTMLALPLLLISAYRLIGLDVASPDLYMALLLQAVASPLMSAPAIAALIGLDVALVLTALVASTVLIPVTAPAFVSLFLGTGLAVRPFEMGLRLFLLLAGAAATAAILTRVLGRARIARRRAEIDGLNVIVMFIFVAALMGSLWRDVAERPMIVLGVAALSFALSVLLIAPTALIFIRSGRAPALALGLLASQRNLGLMLAAMGGAVPDLVWLYFAVAQFPICLLPLIVQPLAARFNRR